MRFALFLCLMSLPAISSAQIKGYPDGVEKVTYRSSADETMQPALFWAPESDENEAVPLLVALHTWSSDYMQAGGEAVYAKWCQKAGWAFIHPHFRGPNRTPDAMGSDLAVGDVISSVDFAKTQIKIDPNRIYCIGVSGGGHMSLMMAGRAPDLWAGVSAWCGISDIAAWHQQCTDNERFIRYAQHIEKVLGSPTEDNSDWLKRAAKRSPVSYLNKATAVNLDINHGAKDGRIGSVPFTHSIAAWNEVVPQSARVPESKYSEFYESVQFPAAPGLEDSLYGTHQPVFRKTSDNTRLTIFDGGHEIVHEAALNWLAAQRKGKPAAWNVEKTIELKTDEKDSESGK